MTGGKVRKLIRLALMGGFLLLGVGTSAVSVLAEEAEAKLTVGQTFTNNSESSVDAKVSYVIKPEDDSNPMPEGLSSDGGFTLDGTDEETFVFQYTKPGIYEYSVYCTQDPANGMYYDGSVYSIKGYAHRDDDGVLTAKMITQKDENKDIEVLFTVYAADVSLQKTLTSSNKVSGVGDQLTWDIIYPMGPDLKRTIDGEVVYAGNMFIYDKMDPRLDYVPYAEIAAYDQDDQCSYTLKKDTDYTEVVDEENSVVTWYITDSEENIGTKRIADEQIKYLYVKITTEVNEKARESADNIWNNAEIEFTNTSGDPYEVTIFDSDAFKESDGDTLPEGVPIAFVGSVKIKTIEENEDGSEGSILPGAVYGVAASKEYAAKGLFIEGLERIVSDENGMIELDGLSPGTYYLVELEVPDPEKYNLLEDPIVLVVGASEGDKDIEVTVKIPKRSSKTTPTPSVSLKPTASATPTATAKATSAPSQKGDGSLKGNGTIKTGDDSKPILYIALGVIAIAIIFFLVAKKRKDESDEPGNA
ncbi:MAG: LPXTG cell wall anchor domain-containing protein [Lachnospiraceae bacterium]|nr:LPXTG cell wall anchor domain-containing protein [Lachnospiraceae bacterium]